MLEKTRPRRLHSAYLHPAMTEEDPDQCLPGDGEMGLQVKRSLRESSILYASAKGAQLPGTFKFVLSQHSPW